MEKAFFHCTSQEKFLPVVTAVAIALFHNLMQLKFVPLGKAIISIQSTGSYFEQINQGDKNLQVQNQTLLVLIFFIQKARPSRNLYSNTLISQLSKIINKEKGETFNQEKKYIFISKTNV